MSKLLRYFLPGQIYFITSVTNEREKILVEYFSVIWDAIEKVQKDSGFELMAWVVLPEHFHFIVDPKNNDPGTIIKRVKLSFAECYRRLNNMYRGKIWQARYWDHIIRNEEDLNNHINYIHYNPIKHGLVESPFKWKYSSIHLYKEKGYYAEDWGVREKMIFKDDYGE